jgi:hypothetical protein
MIINKKNNPICKGLTGKLKRNKANIPASTMASSG